MKSLNAISHTAHLGELSSITLQTYPRKFSRFGSNLMSRVIPFPIHAMQKHQTLLILPWRLNILLGKLKMLETYYVRLETLNSSVVRSKVIREAHSSSPRSALSFGKTFSTFRQLQMLRGRGLSVCRIHNFVLGFLEGMKLGDWTRYCC